MRQVSVGIVCASLSVLILLTSCGNQDTGGLPNKGLQNVKSARSLSAHYVLVEFSEPASKAAESPSNYVILDPQGSSLPVEYVELNESRLEARLTTAEQQSVEYGLVTDGTDAVPVGYPLSEGTLVFLGSAATEPFLESAVSLSDTQVLLTFSNQMDPQTAENILFYEIADPDGNTDIDIRITDAQIQPDYTTVILTTTPQENIQYSIRVTNVQRRFTCNDEGRIFLDNAAQGTSCASNFRPVNSDGTLTSFVLTGRTKIDRQARLDPDATGMGGSVGLEAKGAGVRRPLCTGGTTGIDGGNGSDPDEELIFTADRAELAERVVLGVRELDFGDDRPVLFVSSEGADGFDFVIESPEIQAAFSTGVEAGDIVFANLASLPAGLMIDAVKLRETDGEIWVNSVCGLSIARRLIDPTRNTADFWGIPPVDNDGPRVVRAESISDTEVIVSFSEPLNSEAADPSNFSISPDLIVENAQLTKYDTQIILTTSPQRVDVLYTVTVNNVKDKAGNLIDPTADTATFSYVGGPASLGADALPRVVGAASQGNTSVIVAYNKPMGPSAAVAGNYVIVQENVNPEVGALSVTSAAFLTSQQSAVELTTASQNEVTYLLTAVNVRDLSGNQLAPPQLLVNPATAVFPGTPFSCGPNPCDLPDADGDTIPDATELRGYVVTVRSGDDMVDQREVTSDMNSPDTDGDGLGDEIEQRSGSDPRNPDTDADQLPDFVEFNRVFSSMTNQDTDGDGINDYGEVNFFKTNANLADSDGDGFDDDVELYEMNRDPRVADLPSPTMSIGSVDLHLEEIFSYANEHGQATTQQSSTQSTLSKSSQLTIGGQVSAKAGIESDIGIEGGFGGVPTGWNFKAHGSVKPYFGVAVQISAESTRASMQAFETSMSKGAALTGSTSVSRAVTGGRIDAMVDLGNLGDVAFTLSNLEITVSTLDSADRTQILPVATLVPNSTLVTGGSAEYNIGILDNASRGPIMFTSREVFPTLVEDLMRDPRGLIFEFANYDLTDELGRNFAYASQTARDRTVGLVIDFGDDRVESYFVASAAVRFENATCDTDAEPGCDIVGGFAGFADANIPAYEGLGPPPGLPLEYILEEVLLRRRSEPVVTPVWEPQPAQIIEFDGDGVQVPPDGILVGPNGVSDSIAVGDDLQLIPFGIDGLPEDAVVISAGADGILDSNSASDDPEAVITGYATTRTCGPTTPSSIRPGPNGLVETVRDPLSDDEQLEDFGTTPPTLDTDVIGPGPNGFIDTAPAGDDVYVGPGIPCDDDADCPGAGVCDGQEVLYRFERRARGQFGRIWAVLVPDESLLGLDFRKVVLRPGEGLNLAFIQDLDRDGLISDIEFLFGSSDTRQDTDGDGLDDFSEVRVGWEVGVEGQDLRRVFPDPRLADTDRDGLSDREEQDFRRVQCECFNSFDFDIDTIGDDDGEACTRSSKPDYCVGGDNDANDCTADADCPGGSCLPRPDTPELCRGGTCVNVADWDLPPGTLCSSNPTAIRLDPRRRDTDGDAVTDAEEVLGWLTQAAVIDPQNVIVAGTNRRADTIACPNDICSGGSMDGLPCRFDRDCGSLKVCTKGINDGVPCVNDIECQGPTPALSGLCEEADAVNNPPADPATPLPYKGICNRTGCDDVQVIQVSPECALNGTDCVVGLDERTVVVAPGPDGTLHPVTVANSDDVEIGACSVPPPPPPDSVVCLPGEPDLRASTTAQGDDQQVAIVDSNKALDGSSVLLRTIVRPGINGLLDTLQPSGDDAVAFGQFIQTTDPLKADTDQDQISDGNERRLGSDPRNPADGGMLADRDGDGLTDQQESMIGWAITVDGVNGYETRTVFSNPNNPDSDNDGLPDLAESILRTDPSLRDTDGDTLEDFDEVSDEQFDDLEAFNDLFPGFFLDRSYSKVYGSSPLDCDSDDDLLTDDFEVIEGFDVTVRSENGGIDVFHVFTDPANPDTDFDGLTDGEEFRNRVACKTSADCAAGGSSSECENGTCAALLPTDPTDFDSDGDGRKDGDECTTPLTPPTGCADLTEAPALVECETHPLIPDKRVTIRFVELIMDRGDEDGSGDLVDITWIFGAHRSDEAFPGSEPPLSATEGDCEPPGEYHPCGGGQCRLKEGEVVIFGSDSLGGVCEADAECPDLEMPLFLLWPPVIWAGECVNGSCRACHPPPFDMFCVPTGTGDGVPDNERTFALRPGEGILIYGEVREFDNCDEAKCVGGPFDGAVCSDPDACCDQTDCGLCVPQGEAAAMVTYFKSLSFESAMEGFTVDVGSLIDASPDNDFQVTIVVEIMVE